MTERIQELDSTIEQIARTKYPETELPRQVSGVGTLIALTYEPLRNSQAAASSKKKKKKKFT